MALDRTRLYSEHDGSMDRFVRYMQDGKHFDVNGEEILSEKEKVALAKTLETDRSKAAKAKAEATKAKAEKAVSSLLFPRSILEPD